MSERILDGGHDGRLNAKPSGTQLSYLVWPAAEPNPLMAQRSFVQDMALGALPAPSW